MKHYDKRHGGPYDRGSADAYYGRPFDPHYYLGDSYQSTRIEGTHMTEEEHNEYAAGYEEQDDFKQY